MIFITGDCHSDFRRFDRKIFTEQNEMSKTDYVIIAGDFGGVWSGEKSADLRRENAELDRLNARPFTTLFIDGNHENFDRLNAFPAEQWHGGMVHRIRPSVLHLMRGETYMINGKRFFCFGGASSHDIDDGILDPEKDRNWKRTSKQMDRMGKIRHRVLGVSWWPQELPDQTEMQRGIRSMERADWETDFIVTHEAPASLLPLLGLPSVCRNTLTEYLETIRQKSRYSRWIFGHYHMNRQITDRDIVIYEQIIRIS